MIQSSSEQAIDFDQPAHLSKFSNLSLHLRQNWEAYFIFVLAVFFHLAIIDKAIFNIDETDFYSMARDAVTSGWFPLTGTRASLGNLNPPLIMYLFMLPASFSANPIAGQIMVALVNTASVLLTYFFVRRYYGRLAGTTAALLYTTSAGAWTFSRFIWNPNFLPFFVMLFMLLLFRGVVERKKGWLMWAIPLFGVLYQLHGSALYLLLPLAAALFFAYKSIRPRDIILGLAGLLVVFAPYIPWEFHVHFKDILLLFHQAQQQAHTDTKALRFYLFYIHPTLVNPYVDGSARLRDTHLIVPDNQSILAQAHLHRLLSPVYLVSILLLVTGILLSIWEIFSIHTASATSAKRHILVRWWSEFQANSSRQGLVLLLLWQVVPLLLLSHHSIVLFVHYFIFFLPGQFILIALGLKQSIALVQQLRPNWGQMARYAASALAVLVILAQLLGLGSSIIDIAAGHFQSSVFSDIPDQQNALQLADQIARQRHIDRIYLTSFPTHVKMESMQYLARQIQTPVEFFTAEHCFILPSANAGPVIFLTTSDNVLADAFFAQYANATRVATVPHLGSSPYQIYVVTAKAEPVPVPHAFNQGLQLLSPNVQLIQDQWLTTRWSVQSVHAPAFRSTYGFHFQFASVSGPSLHDTLDCTPTSTWAGDQLFVFHQIQPGDRLPTQIAIQASTFIARPQTLSLGPITGFADHTEDTAWQTLLTDEQKKSITLPVALGMM